MRTLGNLFWLVLVGWWTALAHVAGIASCLTIAGIPLGIQALKLAASRCGRPGETSSSSPGLHRRSDAWAMSWLVLGGLALALGYVIAGVGLCLTIVGIRFGPVTFRMAGLALVPFGNSVVPADRGSPGAAVYLRPSPSLGRRHAGDWVHPAPSVTLRSRPRTRCRAVTG